MPITEIRDSLSVDDAVVVADGEYQLLQKRINLKSGFRNTIMSIDFFDDSAIGATLTATSGYQFFVSKWPVIPTNLNWAETLANSGPSAADDNVLFKAIALREEGAIPYFEEEFPNQFLGAMPTWSFYHDCVYFTLILYGGSGGETITDPQVSFYMALKQDNVDSTEYSMGYYREYMDAQVKLLINQGHFMPNTPALQAGQTFPMWLQGGIRPERVLKADALADWWHQMDGNFAEKTQSVTNLRIFYDAAKTMVAFDQAFGKDDVAKGPVPDWIRMNALPSVIAGPVRAEFPIQIFPTQAEIAAGANNVQVMV
jgi:hypothetical protein